MFWCFCRFSEKSHHLKVNRGTSTSSLFAELLSLPGKGREGKKKAAQGLSKEDLKYFNWFKAEDNKTL